MEIQRKAEDDEEAVNIVDKIDVGNLIPEVDLTTNNKQYAIKPHGGSGSKRKAAPPEKHKLEKLVVSQSTKKSKK